jgi:hypothetical protein
VKPVGRFQGQPGAFWAHVRLLSQEVGYTERATGRIKVPTEDEVRECFRRLELSPHAIFEPTGRLTELGTDLFEYFNRRAELLDRCARTNLMDAKEASRAFRELRARLKPTCPIPMNKQKGEKKRPAYLTAITNMLIEANAKGLPCDYNPLELTTLTRNRTPIRTLARRVDGAFPSGVNPVAVWEVKEYYYTTTFGSRVADGVYETLLDGMELEEVRASEGIAVRHYLIVDGRYTWWDCGKSYLCRIVDMLHMGYVDEVFFGKEIIEALPQVVEKWVEAAKRVGRA